MHRSVQGAVEPDSDDEGTGSDSYSTSGRSNSGSFTLSGSDDDGSESRVRSLTRQLAETAVGVREMSKQLGRARVKSTINSVLIITKARDNHLIKLTRELAIWLMTTPRNGKDAGLIVYVDSQLRQSRRFDAEGIRREHPQAFEPVGNSRPSKSEQQSSGSGTGSGSGRSSSDFRDFRANGASQGTETTADSNYTNHSSNSGSPHGRNGDEGLLRYWTSDMCSRAPHLFDMVVTLGGDGTVLFCSWLFQRIVPPVMPFALGSLGFLTNFDFSDYKKVMSSALDTGVRVNLRMRFTATVYRATLPSDSTMDKRRRRAIRSGKTGEIIMKGVQNCGWDSIETPLPQKGDLRGTYTESTDAARTDEQIRRPVDHETQGRSKKDKEVMCFSTRPVETFEVINDLVVDRGPSPYVSLLEVFGDEHHLTTAQADGLCIATPTGSTAYSLSAGGSLVHPEIPAILISPICPHTLSFRPMLLPDSMELRIAVPYNSRSTAWASFDGRGRVELKQGDHIKVTASKYPFPTVCADNQSTDWFESISRTLKWNERQRQKSFVVVEEGGEEEKDTSQRSSNKPMKKSNNARGGSAPLPNKAGVAEQGTQKLDETDDADDDDDDDDDEENEEQFDIDDTSTAATRASSPQGIEHHERRHSTTDIGSHHHQHHHHYHHRSNQKQPRSANASLPGTPSSAPGTMRTFMGLQPLTSTESRGQTSKADKTSATQAGPPSKVSLSGSPESSTPDPTEAEASSSAHHLNGVETSAVRSLLDSPDRFGLAGPPQPPRALSERHLASADFRLDDNASHEDEKQDQQSSTADQRSTAQDMSTEGKASRRSQDQISSNAFRDSITKIAEKEARIASSSNRLYRNLKSRSSSGLVPTLRDGEKTAAGGVWDAAGAGGTAEMQRDSSRSRMRSSSARPGGTALVVYGQDESDSDSTAEG